jgi:hypothetical protein
VPPASRPTAFGEGNEQGGAAVVRFSARGGTQALGHPSFCTDNPWLARFKPRHL